MVPSLWPSCSFSTAIVCVCPSPTTPSPCCLDVVLFFIRLLSPPLPPTPLLLPPDHPLSLALSWASVQLNLYTLCTHNQPNENPTANTLSAGWSASVPRRLGGPRGGRGRKGLELQRGFSGSPRKWPGWGRCMPYILLCKISHHRPAPKFSDLKQEMCAGPLGGPLPGSVVRVQSSLPEQWPLQGVTEVIGSAFKVAHFNFFKYSFERKRA